MKNTKRIIVSLLSVAVAFTLFACTKNTDNKLPDDFFDNGTEAADGTSEDGTSIEDTVNPPENDNSEKGDTEKEDATADKGEEDGEEENDGKEENKTSEDEASDSDEVVHIIPEAPFSHSEEEKEEIISRYNDAESFYYDMLSQNFELDNMDVILLDSDGYETEYHRVILEDVNSLSELRSLYGMYFTSGFISSVDFSAYREDGGKLYCAATAGSFGGPSAKYTCSVESIDEDSAVLVRKTDGGSQKISAEKIGSGWFFDGVAVR